MIKRTITIPSYSYFLFVYSFTMNLKMQSKSFLHFLWKPFFPGQTPVPSRSGTWILDLSHDPIWAIWLAEVRKFHQHHDGIFHISFLNGCLGESLGKYWQALICSYLRIYHTHILLPSEISGITQMIKRLINHNLAWYVHYSLHMFLRSSWNFRVTLASCSNIQLCVISLVRFAGQ